MHASTRLQANTRCRSAEVECTASARVGLLVSCSLLMHGAVQHGVHSLFKEERFCMSHREDGTPQCSSCQRLAPRWGLYWRHVLTSPLHEMSRPGISADSSAAKARA